jgi:hypothetical protein
MLAVQIGTVIHQRPPRTAWLDVCGKHEERKKPEGGTVVAAVPVTGADTLAEGEFNGFSARDFGRRTPAATRRE